MEQNRILEAATEAVELNNAFLVELEIKPNNVITLYVDADEGLSIDKIKMINRHVEKALDREVEDFNLTVSSPDLVRPLKVRRQYDKNVGRTLKVKHEDRVTTGVLENVNEEGITLVVPPEKKKEDPKTVQVSWKDLTEAKIVVQFK